MNVVYLKSATTAQLALAAETRIRAARIAYRLGDELRASQELDCAEFYVGELVRRWDVAPAIPTQEG